MASYDGKTEFVKVLLKHVADVDLPNNVSIIDWCHALYHQVVGSENGRNVFRIVWSNVVDACVGHIHLVYRGCRNMSYLHSSRWETCYCYASWLVFLMLSLLSFPIFNSTHSSLFNLLVCVSTVVSTLLYMQRSMEAERYTFFPTFLAHPTSDCHWRLPTFTVVVSYRGVFADNCRLPYLF